MTIYRIELPSGKEADFERLMLDEVFPSINKGPTRAGQVTTLRLLKGNTVGSTNQYIWLVDGDSLINGGPARTGLEKIEAFGANVSDKGDYVEVGDWSSQENDEN